MEKFQIEEQISGKNMNDDKQSGRKSRKTDTNQWLMLSFLTLNSPNP